MTSAPPPLCRRCGRALPADAPHGLCPACLVAMNFASQTELPGDPGGPVFPPPSPEELAPHFPQLEILELLGRGGMGVVYKARQKALGRLVALKLLAPGREHDASFAERFAREAQALAALDHPSIVTVHDFGQTHGYFYLLMEYVDGLNLRQVLRAGKLRPEEALGIVPALCDALQFAHDRGIVHRDIKPENLLLARDGRVKVADFGVARIVGREGLSEEAVGTPAYMAPEQRQAPHRGDHRADVYSLGVVLYEMLTGELPKGDFAPPSRRVAVDVRVDEVVLRALESSPELRWQTAASFRTGVETCAEARRAASPPPRRWLRALGLILAGVLMGSAALAGLSVLAYYALRHREGERAATVSPASREPRSAPHSLSFFGDEEHSAYVAQDAERVHFVLYHPGKIKSCESAGSRQKPDGSWTDAGSVVLENGRAFGFHRDSERPGRLVVNGAAFELSEGDSILLEAEGTARALRGAVPVVTTENFPAVAATLDQAARPGAPAAEAPAAAAHAAETFVLLVTGVERVSGPAGVRMSVSENLLEGSTFAAWVDTARPAGQGAPLVLERARSPAGGGLRWALSGAIDRGALETLAARMAEEWKGAHVLAVGGETEFGQITTPDGQIHFLRARHLPAPPRGPSAAPPAGISATEAIDAARERCAADLATYRSAAAAYGEKRMSTADLEKARFPVEYAQAVREGAAETADHLLQAYQNNCSARFAFALREKYLSPMQYREALRELAEECAQVRAACAPLAGLGAGGAERVEFPVTPLSLAEWAIASVTHPAGSREIRLTLKRDPAPHLYLISSVTGEGGDTETTCLPPRWDPPGAAPVIVWKTPAGFSDEFLDHAAASMEATWKGDRFLPSEPPREFGTLETEAGVSFHLRASLSRTPAPGK